MLFVAGSEPEALRAIATKVTNVTENYGVDVYFIANRVKVGVQRKELKDLLASVNDGRLVKELLQMTQLDAKFLVVEGVPTYSTDGTLLNNIFGKRWTEAQFTGLLLSIIDRGVHIIQTRDVGETVKVVQYIHTWFTKAKHSTLMTRPGLGKGQWGTGVSEREFGVWFLQSIPGVGHELAERIWDEFGGMPVELKVGVKELMQVQGIGKKKAEDIVRLFGKVEGNE